MEPAVEMENMGENEDKCDVASDSLPSVAPVPSQAIPIQVGVPGARNPDTNNRMKNDRQKNKQPLDHWQEWQGMDRENRVLKNVDPACQARVGHEVDAHVGSDRYQPAKGMQPADKEVMALKKTGANRPGRGGFARLRCRVARGSHVS
jgi:hypothetical protein